MDAPPDLVLCVPIPPSANRLWRKRAGQRGLYPSPDYTEWKLTAGWLAKTQLPQWGKLSGPFRVAIAVPHTQRDLGNWEKPLLDLAQSIGAIDNDKLATKIELEVCPDRKDCLLTFWRTEAIAKPRLKVPRKRAERPTPSRVAKVNRIRAKVLF